MRRRFELREGRNNKFWEIELDGTLIRTWSGDIDSDGHGSIIARNTLDEAESDFHKLVMERLAMGYSEVAS
jgi:predicted DNA-binding WGR domain protein